ncbi:glycosyltransferase [Leptospira sp. 201903074]|uniref:glycosyltransferase family 2 protein n=1 Tax=Leptospira abararensis TaxID=2810036 RepID=UPI0019665558|nr:glycosyltransferase family 2 protein [Leptospira abararensis]MBM9547012.1 glycosyltransferase [Leptospira abararensis]
MNQTDNIKIISIVTPSFQQGEFIERTINSVITQEGDFLLDYIITDGGSRDNTLQVIQKYDLLISEAEEVYRNDDLVYKKIPPGNKHSTNCLGISFRWVSEKDNGQTHAINKGWKLAVGSVIAWLNSDDVYLPKALEKAYKVLSESDLMGLYGIGLHIDKEDRLIEFYPIEPYSMDRLIDYCIICQPTVFLKKEVLTSVGFLNESLGYCMDYEYWLRIAKNFPFQFLREILACTRIHENTKTSQNLKVHREIVKMQKRVIGKTSRHWLYHYSYYRLSDLFPRWKGSLLLKLMIRIHSLILWIIYR